MAEISPLRRRMIEDMTVRNLSPATQQCIPPPTLSITHIFGLLSGTSGDENLNQKNPL